ELILKIGRLITSMTFDLRNVQTADGAHYTLSHGQTVLIWPVWSSPPPGISRRPVFAKMKVAFQIIASTHCLSVRRSPRSHAEIPRQALKVFAAKKCPKTAHN